MKHIFIPLYKIILWLGRVIRSICYFIWNFKKRPKQVIDHDENKERRKNGIVGIISFVAAIAAIIGAYHEFFRGTTSSDIDELEIMLSKSFNRMEEMEYMTTSNTLLFQDTLSENIKLRGEAKVLSTLLRSQFDFWTSLDIKSLDTTFVVKTIGVSMHDDLINYINQYNDYSYRVMQYFFNLNDIENKRQYIINYYYTPRFYFLQQKIESLSKQQLQILLREQKTMKDVESIDEFKAIYSNVINNKDLILLWKEMIHYLELIYEYLIEVDLCEHYLSDELAYTQDTNLWSDYFLRIFPLVRKNNFIRNYERPISSK